ncbi:MAG TPA: TetR/AcrR family transcriptional regulator [Solirubrobacteraceae bacterium]
MRGERRQEHALRGATARRPDAKAPRERLGKDIGALQRTRLLRSAVGLLAEQGYESVSVTAICTRAGVSRRTYYEVFENRDECLAEILADAEASVLRAIAQAGIDGAAWRERIRGGLWAILSLADSDPALARACLIESQRAGGMVGAERERILSRLVRVVDEGRSQSARAATAGSLTAEALVGAIGAVLAARLRDTGENGRGRDHPQLQRLLGELASMVVLPYLGSGAARRELERPLPATPAIGGLDLGTAVDGPDPLASLPMRLTYRTARVVQAAAELGKPGLGASNRQIAEHAGIADQGQVSKLLARLEHHGLLANAAKDSAMRGEANRWMLTHAGARLARSLGVIDVKRPKLSVT